jgi:hypothetical protein
MRGNRILLLMLVMVGALLFSGCSLNVQRNTLKVDKALVGHWVNTKGTPDYYISDTGLTKVDRGGSTTYMTYVVLKSNDNDNTITIRVNNPTGVILDEDIRDIKFSTDKKTMTETVSLLGIKISEENFTYVDSKTKP